MFLLKNKSKKVNLIRERIQRIEQMLKGRKWLGNEGEFLTRNRMHEAEFPGVERLSG